MLIQLAASPSFFLVLSTTILLATSFPLCAYGVPSPIPKRGAFDDQEKSFSQQVARFSQPTLSHLSESKSILLSSISLNVASQSVSTDGADFDHDPETSIAPPALVSCQLASPAVGNDSGLATLQRATSPGSVLPASEPTTPAHRSRRDPRLFSCWLSDGSYYQGQLADGQPDGVGQLMAADGSFYRGEWRSGEPVGVGVSLLANGDRYEGYFASGMYNGKGSYVFANGRYYEGTFTNNQIQGQGRFSIPGDDRTYAVRF